MINNTNVIRILNSKCNIIEIDIDKSKSAYFKNTFKDINIEDGASLNYFFINLINLKHFYTNNTININKLNAKKGSKFNYFIFGSGSKFRKDDYEIL